jgi:hypothetical protein
VRALGSLAFGSVTGGYEPYDDDEPLPRPDQPDRMWQHPSEVGQAVRGRVDRRRSSVLATGLVLSGLGLLVTGVLMGQMPDAEEPAPPATPTELAAPSLVEVTAVDPEGVSHSSTGVVIDERGHLLVTAERLASAEDVWARADGDELRRGVVIGIDDHLGIAVLRVDRGPADSIGPAPRLASPSSAEPVEVLHRQRKGVSAARAWLSAAPVSPVALTAMTVPRTRPADLRLRPADDAHLEAGPVFDDGGRLVALVTESGGPDATGTIPAVPARIALAAGVELLDG